MNSYQITVSMDGQLYSQGFSVANNAMEAFEIACDQGVLPMPSCCQVVVVVERDNGLKVSFDAQMY